MTDIKQHCCGADLLFDAKTAQKQYKQYLKKGPSRVTKVLLSQLQNLSIKDSLIDIGGGIGAIQWWFLNEGGKKVYGLDASSGYTALVKKHAQENGFSDRTSYFIGDFTNLSNDIPEVDHLTLDKVICCYPDYVAIIDQACAKSIHTLSLSYPMDGIIASIFRSIGVLFMKLKGNPFRPYVHQVSSVRALIKNNGFEISKRELSFPWHVETYIRK